jgi:hypothetical protein
VEKTWEQWLGPLVPALPRFETVIGELKPQIENLLEGNNEDDQMREKSNAKKNLNKPVYRGSIQFIYILKMYLNNQFI